MMYSKLVRRSLGTVKFELRCHLFSLVGFLRAKRRFDRSADNQLEIGSGPQRRPGFSTIDLSLASDYPFDLRIGLPFPDESVNLIYAEHVLEHLSIRDLQHLLGECMRVLKPKGRLSVVVPDARIFVEAYMKGDASAFKEKYCGYEFGLPYEARIDILNYIFYMDGHHRYMFDAEGMLALLRRCGFSSVNERAFDPGMDMAARQQESIYFTAQK
jgi:SAM-dependent methyltransferase